MRKKLTHNLGLKIISALFAIVLWLVVVNTIDPVENKTFNNIQVSVENESVIENQDKVYDIIDNSDTISVSVKGRRSALESLKSTDFLAVADMKEMIVTDTVPIEVTVTRYNDRIEEIIPKTKTLKISIEDSATKQFAINTNISGTPGDGFAVGDISCNPSVLKVMGAASVVNKISKVAVTVDVEGMTDTINTSATPKFYDSDGDIIESTSLEYKSEDIEVSIDLLKTKEIELNFGFKGTPADDYQCVGTVCSPDKITIAGEDEELAKVDGLSITNNEIDVTDATANVQQVIDITSYLPSTVRLVDSSEASILVTAIIEKLQTKSIEVTMDSIVLQNVPSSYTASYASTENVLVVVKGLTEVVGQINASNITASVDLSKIKEAGTKTLPVDITLSEGIEAQVVGEVNINVLITRNNSNANSNDVRP